MQHTHCSLNVHDGPSEREWEAYYRGRAGPVMIPIAQREIADPRWTKCCYGTMEYPVETVSMPLPNTKVCVQCAFVQSVCPTWPKTIVCMQPAVDSEQWRGTVCGHVWS